jgi:hypothetical protein
VLLIFKGTGPRLPTTLSPRRGPFFSQSARQDTGRPLHQTADRAHGAAPRSTRNRVDGRGFARRSITPLGLSDSRRGCPAGLVPINHTASHHEDNAPDCGNDLQRVAIRSHEIRLEARGKHPPTRRTPLSGQLTPSRGCCGPRRPCPRRFYRSALAKAPARRIVQSPSLPHWEWFLLGDGKQGRKAPKRGRSRRHP